MTETQKKKNTRHTSQWQRFGVYCLVKYRCLMVGQVVWLRGTGLVRERVSLDVATLYAIKKWRILNMYGCNTLIITLISYPGRPIDLGPVGKEVSFSQDFTYVQLDWVLQIDHCPPNCSQLGPNETLHYMFMVSLGHLAKKLALGKTSTSIPRTNGTMGKIKPSRSLI